MDYIPEAEVTEQLGLPPNTLPGLRRSKKGPKWYKFGTKAYYLQEDVDAWVAACAQDPSTDADTDEVDEVEQSEEGDGDE